MTVRVERPFGGRISPPFRGFSPIVVYAGGGRIYPFDFLLWGPPLSAGYEWTQTGC